MENIRNFVIIAHIDHRAARAALSQNLSVLSNFLHGETPVSPTPFPIDLGN